MTRKILAVSTVGAFAIGAAACTSDGTDDSPGDDPIEEPAGDIGDDVEEPVDDGPRPRSLEQFLSDDDAPTPDDDAIEAQELVRMHSGMQSVLTERHRFVLIRRYGLEDSQFRTLSEVGRDMGLSRERVRQIEREALRRLREHAGIREAVNG